MPLLSVFKYPFGLLFKMDLKLIYIMPMKEIETFGLLVNVRFKHSHRRCGYKILRSQLVFPISRK